jgi:hypothetical protein
MARRVRELFGYGLTDRGIMLKHNLRTDHSPLTTDH